MSFSRKALTMALAGMVGAGFTGAALADSTMTQDANGSTGTYSSSDTSHSTGASSSTLNDASAAPGTDQANRATSPQNPPADRLPATRGENGDDAAASGSAGIAGSTNGMSGSTNGNSEASGLSGVSAAPSAPGMSGNAAGTAGSNDAEHAPTPHAATLDDNGSSVNAGASGSTSVNGNADVNGSADVNAPSAGPDASRLPANRSQDHTGTGSLRNGGLTGPSSTINSRGTTTESTSQPRNP